MTLFPKHLVLIRHGQSEANIHVDSQGHTVAETWPDEFRTNHPSSIRLTDEGVLQAQKTGEWLKQEFPRGFEAYAVSEYIRARETAAHLNIEKANWIIDPYFRETDRGKLDHVPLSELTPEEVAVYKSELRWFSRVAGAETMSEVCMRGELGLMRLKQISPRGPAIVVSHGGMMWKMRQRIEGWSVAEYHERTSDKAQHLNNCGLVEYKAQQGELWVRTGTPHLKVIGEWEKVITPTVSNEELLRQVSVWPRLSDPKS